MVEEKVLRLQPFTEILPKPLIIGLGATLLDDNSSVFQLGYKDFLIIKDIKSDIKENSKNLILRH